MTVSGCFDGELDNFASRDDSSAENATSSSTDAAAPSELLIDDFEDGDTGASNGFGWWYTANDTVGDQDFRISEIADRPRSSRAANSSGIGFEVWGALVGLDLTPGSGNYDASAFRELRFWARAAPDSVTTFSARLLERGESHFETPIELGSEWQEYVLRFDSLSAVDGSERTIDSSAVSALQVFVFSSERFNFWIDDVVFVGGP
jgi:hypothetical protein